MNHKELLDLFNKAKTKNVKLSDEQMTKILMEEIERGGGTDQIITRLRLRAEHPELEGQLIAFFGFSGPLQGVFCLISEQEKDAVKARIAMISPLTSVSFKTVHEFYTIHDAYKNDLKFEKLSLERIYQQLALAPHRHDGTYVEPEREEFDENCLPTCRPGDHQCGKKR
ncbi:MAG: hypothetical protein KW793_03625 [Candidatus Doudnabacteria bacterium]|nr:hypothetical protein [Candidatus Doudnabacteria bacterium]